MSDIPVTAKEFKAWLEKNNAEWPPELQKLGHIAWRTLDQIDGNPPWHQEALKEQAPNYFRMQANHLLAFAEAYGAWKSKA